MRAGSGRVGLGPPVGVGPPPAGASAARWPLTAAVLRPLRQHGDVLKNASSLLATTGVTSAMGFAYWTIAARMFSQRAVGYGSATISAVTLLATVGMFGLGTLLIGELPRRTRRGGLVAAALITSGLGSLVVGLGFAVLAPMLSSRFAAITGTPMRTVLVTVSVVLMAVGLVFDQATIGVLRGGVQLFRNLVFSLIKLMLLPVTAFIMHDQLGAGIVASWAVGMLVSLAACAFQLWRTGAAVLCRPDWRVLRALGRTTFAHNWLNLAIAVPYSLIPVLVTVVVSPTANAAFYAAWMLASFIYIIPQHLSTVLFAVASADPQVIARKLRFTIKVALLVGLPASAVLGLGARLALGLFGADYARLATFPLMLLALGYLPSIPKVYYIAVCRAIGKINRAALVLTSFAAVEVAIAAVAGYLGGLVGLSVALLTVAVVEGIATTPTVVKAAMGRGRHRRAQANGPANGPANGWANGSAFGSENGQVAEGAYRSSRAQQEAGLAVLLSLATTIGPDHLIPGLPNTAPQAILREPMHYRVNR